MLCVDGMFMFFFSTRQLWFDCEWMAIFPLCWNHLHNHLHKFCSFLLHFLTPSPNGSMFCFNQLYKQFIVSLVHIWHCWYLVRDPSQKSRRPVVSSKVALLLPGSGPSTTFGSILVLTIWRCCCGRVEDYPWRNDKNCMISGKIFLRANKDFYIHEKVVYLSWRLHTHFDRYHTRSPSFQKDPHER